MKKFKDKYGPWAIITGASSGIGEEFCKQLAALSFNIVMVSRRKEKLTQLSDVLKSKFKIDTKVVSVDLSDLNFINKIMTKTKSLKIGLLINDAGFALTGNFLENSTEDEVKLLDVNCKAPLILSNKFGKIMKENNRGGIINIASASAFLPMPKWANYSASKAYLLSLSEALWFELKQNNIDVLAVCPSSVNTKFSKVAKTRGGGISASEVVELALKNLGKKQIVIPGQSVKFGVFIMSHFFSRKFKIKLGARAVDNLMSQDTK